MTDMIKRRTLSIETQGRYRIKDRVVYYKENNPKWLLYEDNYHEMTIIMTRLLNNGIPLYTKATEWHPTENKEKKIIRKRL